MYSMYLSCLVVYPIVLYYIMTRADTAKYGRFNTALRLHLHKILVFNVQEYHSCMTCTDEFVLSSLTKTLVTSLG